MALKAKKKPAAKKTAAKKKPVAKKTAPKRTAKKAAPKRTIAKKTAPKRTPAKKAAPRKKAIGFEMMKSHQNALEKGFEELAGYFDNFSELLNEFVYDGKKAAAATSRAALMDITKKAKELRTIIQEAKVKLKPIYKD
jgi:hypothetical protein